MSTLSVKPRGHPVWGLKEECRPIPDGIVYDSTFKNLIQETCTRNFTVCHAFLYKFFLYKNLATNK